MARYTIPGSTQFKVWLNSHLRKLLRKDAPESYWWTAHTTLEDGEELFAQFEIIVVLRKHSIVRREDAPTISELTLPPSIL